MARPTVRAVLRGRAELQAAARHAGSGPGCLCRSHLAAIKWAPP